MEGELVRPTTGTYVGEGAIGVAVYVKRMYSQCCQNSRGLQSVCQHIYKARGW